LQGLARLDSRSSVTLGRRRDRGRLL